VRLGQEASGRYTLDVARGGSTERLTAWQVVLTLPLTTLRDVELGPEVVATLPPRLRRALAELRYGQHAKLMVGFTDRVWRSAHGSNGSLFTDTGLQCTWETSRLQPGRGGVLTAFLGGPPAVAVGAGTAREQADRAAQQLEQIFPGIAATRAGAPEARFHWASHAWSKGGYLCHGPGQWTTLRGVFGEPVGRLHFAGEHTALDNQGYMEGGCETGERAASAVLSQRTMTAATS
jgi:monoamine oxidase